jgi:hypothetical protein
MKKTIVVLFATGFFAIAANAQDVPQTSGTPTPPPMMSKEDRAKMKAEREAKLTQSLKDVGASDDQIQQVKAVLEETHKKHEALKKDASISDEDKKAKGKEIMEAQKAKIKEILGEEKAKQFAESQRGRMFQKMPATPPPAPAP